MSEQLPDPNYRIDAAARARLREGVDPNALELLLQHFPAASRARHLEMFSQLSGKYLVGGRVLTAISDPSQQAMLDEVWQPYWASMSDRELFEGSGGPPGRELAKRRRRGNHGV
jgi:hypothetical protein